MTERAIKRAVLRVCARGPVRLFNNPVGHAVRVDGSRIVYGLAPGSADLIGWRSIEVTPDMVGRRLAVFCALEVKAPRGVATAGQLAFLGAVTAAGGIAGVVRSDAEAAAVLGVSAQT